MRSLPVVATTHALERFVERWPQAADEAEGVIVREVSAAVAAGRVACRLPRRVWPKGRRPRPGTPAGRYAWSPDFSRIFVIRRAANGRRRERVVLVVTVFARREPADWERWPGEPAHEMETA